MVDRRSAVAMIEGVSEHCNKHDTTTLALQTEFIGLGNFFFLSFYLYRGAEEEVCQIATLEDASLSRTKTKGKALFKNNIDLSMCIHIKLLSGLE